MAFDIDRVALLYAVGILLGVVATFYFGFQLLEELSPVTTALLLLFGFVGLFIGGVALEAERLDVVLYALSAGCYLVFVAYVLTTFEFGDGGTFLLLALSSALFIGLGYLASRDQLTLSRQRAQLGIVAVLLLGVALVGIDVVGAQPTQSVEFETEIEVPDADPRGTVTLGTVTIENEFFLPRQADVSRYYACVYVPDREFAPLQFDPRGGTLLLDGGETRQFEVTLPSRVFYDGDELHEGLREYETVPVERADVCPEEAEDPQIVIVTDHPGP